MTVILSQISQALALPLLSLAIACSGGTGTTNVPATSGSAGSAAVNGGGGQSAAAGGASGMGASPSTTSGGAVTVVDDGKPFVPADIKYSIVEDSRALTLLSATVVNNSTGVQWLIAVRNDEAVPICRPEVNAVFTDAADSSNNPGGETSIMIQGAMYQSDSGAYPCLLPGAIGMGWQGVGELRSAMPNIVAIEYRAEGYLSPEAMKLPDLAVDGVMITNDPAGGKQVTGNVTNHSTTSAARPELNIFAVDSGGRPFDAGYASSMTDLVPGSSWSFKLNVPTPFNKYVAFPVWAPRANDF